MPFQILLPALPSWSEFLRGRGQNREERERNSLGFTSPECEGCAASQPSCLHAGEGGTSVAEGLRPREAYGAKDESWCTPVSKFSRTWSSDVQGRGCCSWRESKNSSFLCIFGSFGLQLTNSGSSHLAPGSNSYPEQPMTNPGVMLVCQPPVFPLTQVVWLLTFTITHALHWIKMGEKFILRLSTAIFIKTWGGGIPFSLTWSTSCTQNKELGALPE